jgi:hypothetical protein
MLRLQTYTASDPGFTVNSHLVMGEKEAILVDVQFLRNEAKKVYSEIPPTIEYSITNRAKELESIDHEHTGQMVGMCQMEYRR